MNPRHAAALALVGWYLMVPPNGGGPVSGKWIINSSYDSAKECEKAGEKLRENTQYVLRRNPDAPGIEFMAATCIATDDPRLKGN